MPTPPSVQLAGSAALALLVLLGGVYLLTVDAAPSVRVRWQDSVTADRQAVLEKAYQLVDGGSPMPDAPRSLAYVLLDTSRRNIRALVTSPDVLDTNDIDREAFTVAPSAARSSRRVWFAHRMPVLRDAAVRTAVIMALALIALVGLVRPLAASPPVAGLRRWMRTDHDVFDRLDGARQAGTTESASPSGPAAGALLKLGAAVLVVIAAGLPILETWKAFTVATALLAIGFGIGPASRRSLATAAAIVLAVVGLKALFPRADIAEGHNAFLVRGDGEALERGLPPAVFRSWRQQFEALYPPRDAPPVPNSWRATGAVPTAVFARSADAIWRRSKLTRQVDVIDFHTLAEFRGGFVNDPLYNFWDGDLSRRWLPFYAMYELTPASVGSRLTWTGQAFWERGDGQFEEIVHQEPAARVIAPEDAGRHVYAVFFPQSAAQLGMRLEPSPTLRLAAWMSMLLSVAGVVAVTLLAGRPVWEKYLRALVLLAAGYLLALAFSFDGYLGRQYAPQAGGGDGMSHDWLGRTMAMLVGQGQLVAALQGGEPVYWLTPGTRYLRMIEKLVFGDTNHLFLLIIALMPVLVFYLMRRFVRTPTAWMLTAAFLVVPVGNLSFPHYVSNATSGYGDAVGVALFLFALIVILRTQKAQQGIDDVTVPAAWAAGAALAAAVFLRPNFVFAVAWLGSAGLWMFWRRGEAAAAIALAIGIGLALWMPVHNWYYGEAFYLISQSGSTISVPLGISDYLQALADTIQGRSSSPAVQTVLAQIQGWLMAPGFFYRPWMQPLAWGAHALKLAGLIAACGVVIRWVAARFSTPADLPVIAVAALLAHAPMLVVFNTDYRYAMLGWDLSLLVLIVWCARLRHTADAAATEPRQLLVYAPTAPEGRTRS